MENEDAKMQMNETVDEPFAPERKVDRRFSSFPVSEQAKMSIESLRVYYATLAEIVEERCPNSRERSIALTELENSCMWAIKSITHN